MRYAVYVEGKAEMLFVADILSKYSGYDPSLVGFQCINLNADSFGPVSYPIQGDDKSQVYYQIVNVNNDKRVISKLRQDIPNLMEQGFEVIIGLRDVFGAEYDSLCGEQIINKSLIGEMHRAQSEQIRFEGVDTRLHFAIMEYEAWMMALLDKFIESKGYDVKSVFSAAGIDYNSDFEDSVFHPYNKVQKIFETMGSHYGKHEGDQFSFLSFLAKEDYESLRYSGKCASFGKFIDSLMGGVKPMLCQAFKSLRSIVEQPSFPDITEEEIEKEISDYRSGK